MLILVFYLYILRLNGLEVAKNQLVGGRVQAYLIDDSLGHWVDFPVFIDHDELMGFGVDGHEHGDVEQGVSLGNEVFHVFDS